MSKNSATTTPASTTPATTTPASTSLASAPPEAPGSDDPRFGLAVVIEELGHLIEATTPDMLTNATPCTDFQVKDLLEHCVMVVRRIAAIGRGEHWSTVEQEATDGGWLDDYRTGAHAIMDAWADPAKLQAVHPVPWGEFPGAILMYVYSAELAVHGWDLSQATGLSFQINDDQLQGALFAAKSIPAEGRGAEVPFDEVVDPGPDAPVLDQMAGWMGRNVLGAWSETHTAAALPTSDLATA